MSKPYRADQGNYQPKGDRPSFYNLDARDAHDVFMLRLRCATIVQSNTTLKLQQRADRRLDITITPLSSCVQQADGISHMITNP